jgi:hypothetical protein
MKREIGVPDKEKDFLHVEDSKRCLSPSTVRGSKTSQRVFYFVFVLAVLGFELMATR